MAGKDFSEYVQGKTFDEILHEGRRESADRILSEALTPLFAPFTGVAQGAPDLASGFGRVEPFGCPFDKPSG